MLDRFIGGYPITDSYELGTFVFYQSDSQKHNVTGRLYDAFTNKTFSETYQMTLYQGQGVYNESALELSSQRYKFLAKDNYYNGFFDLNGLNSGAWVAITESKGYMHNLQRFYALPSPPYTEQMRPMPMVPDLKAGELSLVLTWDHAPKDLDLHVEFAVSPTTLCKSDFSMHSCGGVNYLTDSDEGYTGADTIKFD